MYEETVLPDVILHGAVCAEPRPAYRLLAEAGAALRERLFDPTGDAEPARRVANWPCDLRATAQEDDPVAIEVVNEADRPVPWNLIYDEVTSDALFTAPNAESSADWEPFWAIRYNVFGGRRVDPRRRRPISGPDLRVVFLTHPAALEGLDGQRAWLDRFTAGGRTRVLTRSDELPGVLTGGRPDVLYCLCHSSEGGLQLDGGPLDPDELFDLLGKAGGRDVPGGLVFLNSCRSAVPRPGEASFWRNVFDLGMSGLIGTKHDTLNTVAAPPGNAVRDFVIFDPRIPQVSQAFLDDISRRFPKWHRGRCAAAVLWGSNRQKSEGFQRFIIAHGVAHDRSLLSPLSSCSRGASVRTRQPAHTRRSAGRSCEVHSRPALELRAEDWL